MNAETPKEFQRWEVTRRKGKLNFILIRGVLAYGLPMFLLMTLFANRDPEKPLAPVLIIISAAVWAVGGAVFGWAMWALTERRYKKYLATRTPAPSDQS